MVVANLVADKRLIVDLFQKCGREELKFIVTTGLWGGRIILIFFRLIFFLFSLLQFYDSVKVVMLFSHFFSQECSSECSR